MKKNSFIFILLLFSLNIYAQEIKIVPPSDDDSRRVTIYYESIHKQVEFASLSPEDIKNIHIETTSDNIRYEKNLESLKIYLKGTPCVKYYKNTIESHVGTLFINGEGIELENNVYLIKDGYYLLGGFS